MLYTAVHEHVREWLPPAEQRGLPVMEAKRIIKIYALQAEYIPEGKNQNIDDKEIFNN